MFPKGGNPQRHGQNPSLVEIKSKVTGHLDQQNKLQSFSVRFFDKNGNELSQKPEVRDFLSPFSFSPSEIAT